MHFWNLKNVKYIFSNTEAHYHRKVSNEHITQWEAAKNRCKTVQNMFQQRIKCNIISQSKCNFLSHRHGQCTAMIQSDLVCITHTHTHLFNGFFSRTTQVSRYHKGKTSLDFTEASDSEWKWHQLGHMQVCTSLQTDNHARTPPLSFFTGQMPFLPPNQQR